MAEPTTTGAGLATKGSQRQLQIHVNVPELRDRLEAQLNGATSSIAQGSIEWKSPLLSEAYREYFDSGFVSAIGSPGLAPELKEFWPRRGPVWDGLATFRTPDGERGVLLIEAKAHANELLRGGSLGKSVGTDSRRLIEKRLAETRAQLEIDADPEDWTVNRYQSANRLAHAVWLTERVPTLLAHVIFYNDPTHIAEPETSILDAARQVYEGLGFTGGGPQFAVTVSCPAVDPMMVAAADIPEWARRPVDLDGLTVKHGSYPPEQGNQDREDPNWALVGEFGRDSHEIAVAAFPEGVEFSSLTICWDGQHPVPAVKPLQRVAWAEFPDDADAAKASLRLVARATVKRRRQSYRRCAGCKRWVAPEDRNRVHNRYSCHGCQERLHGVAH